MPHLVALSRVFAALFARSGCLGSKSQQAFVPKAGCLRQGYGSLWYIEWRWLRLGGRFPMPCTNPSLPYESRRTSRQRPSQSNCPCHSLITAGYGCERQTYSLAFASRRGGARHTARLRTGVQ